MLKVLHPGIFFEENIVNDGSSTRLTTQATTLSNQTPSAIGAFVGVAPRGEVGKAVEVNSWTEYVAQFGGFSADSSLAYSVKGFFENGGSKCYVVRVVKMTGAVKASASASVIIKDANATPADSIQFKAISDGLWGNDISVAVPKVDAVANTFNLEVYYKGVLAESVEGATLADIEESVNGVSKFVTCIVTGSAIPAVVTATNLIGGLDGITGMADEDYLGTKENANGLYALDNVKINLVAIPSVATAPVHTGLLAYASTKGAFAILDAPMNMTASQVATYVTTTAKLVSDDGAIFYPFIKVSDPIGVGKNPSKIVAPSGHIMGVFARQDATNGVWRAPAGVDCNLLGILGLQKEVTDPDQDILNPINVNCLRSFDGYGVVIWGDRTLSANKELKYIPSRRTITFVEDSLSEDMKWTNFMPNDETLWGMIKSNVEQFLNGIWTNRGLKGEKAEEAYTVKCDKEINTQEVIDAGKTYCDIGIALNEPNEFTIFRLNLKN
jgi:phage tail sheath protein FI